MARNSYIKANPHIEVDVLRVSIINMRDSLELVQCSLVILVLDDCRWLFTDENKGATVMAHNGSVMIIDLF
jgi:hypothetical protein